LSITYGIVKEHGGMISVVSAPGEGATFLIHLPLASADTGEPAAP
jgi:signal transduction histidine kinase